MRKLGFLLACLPAFAACASVSVPLVSPQHPRQRILVQREFRLGTFDFGKAAGEASELGDIIPAMLLTELRDGGRFAIYEGGNIRTGGSEPLNEGNASQYVDGYLSGTLTTVGGQQACLDLRLSNAVTHEVLYTRSVCIAVEDDRRVDRGAVKRIAEEIARAVKQVGNGKVTSTDGQIVFCDKGSRAGVSRGMVAYIVATGDTVADRAIHDEVQRYTGVDPAQLSTVAAPVIVGEMYVVSVDERYSQGLLYKGNYVLPGDTVFFK
jgi:curli biogenesis system outer membrane secretion channel CsgG